MAYPVQTLIAAFAAAPQFKPQYAVNCCACLSQKE